MNNYAQNRGGFSRPVRQHGLTLVELMISITLGLLVVLAATAMLLASKSSYTTMDDDTVVRDNARFAIENITRSLRQAAFENWEKPETSFLPELPGAPINSRPKMSANLLGANADDLTFKSEDGLTTYFTITSTNNNDILAVRFFGAGSPEKLDDPKVTATSIRQGGYGSIVNCLGMAVAAPTKQESAANDRGWSIYYVGQDASGEPVLRCKTRSENDASKWVDEVIARGIESFQVLYGVDTDDQYLPLKTGETEKKPNPEYRIPNYYLTAAQIDALDKVAATKPENKTKILNQYTSWKKVSVVKVALLVRGKKIVETGSETEPYYLFGEDYSTANAANDPGTTISVTSMDAAARRRVRKVFLGTIQYRSVGEGSGDKDKAE